MSDARGHTPGLPPDDQRLLDALVESGFEIDALHLTERQRARAEAMGRLFELLEDYPIEDADPSLVDATLARIDRTDRDRVSRMRIASRDETQVGRRLRLPDFVTVAAVLLIGASILLPVMHQMRQRSIDAGCENNMRVLGYAFAQYAGDYGNELPVAQAGLNQSFSRFASNVLNLTPLLDNGYCEHGHLRCPGHESKIGDSYGYQLQMAGTRANWAASPGVLVLGDRNPLIEAFRVGESLPSTALSPNHGGRGQYVLSTDGWYMFLNTSVVGNDNIWLPEGVDTLEDGARPSGPKDVFLAQ